MRCFFAVDEGLPRQIQTGAGLDTVASMQSAVKYLVKCKDTEACTVDEIEVYPIGVTRYNYKEHTPLKPTDKLPKGSTTKAYIFVHVPYEEQDLTALQRRLHSNPPQYYSDEDDDEFARRAAEEEAEAARRAAKEQARQRAEEEKRRQEEEDAARRAAEEEAHRAAEEEGRKRAEASDADVQVPMEFAPTPMPTRARLYYQLGDTVVYYIYADCLETIADLKDGIVETRGERNTPYLRSLRSATHLKVFPPGTTADNGMELEEEDPIPTNSTWDAPFIVVK